MGVHISQLPQEVKDRLGLKDTAYRQFWAIVGDKEKIFFRSEWEFYYSLFLEKLKQEGKIKDWFHEPKTFFFDKVKRGIRTYLPDYLIVHLNNEQEWVEVKGYMSDDSKTKINRFRKYYPELKLRVVSGDWFKENLKWCKVLEPILAKRVQTKV